MILWLTLIRIQGEGCVLHILRKGRVQAWAGTGVSRVSSVCEVYISASAALLFVIIFQNGGPQTWTHVRMTLER